MTEGTKHDVYTNTYILRHNVKKELVPLPHIKPFHLRHLSHPYKIHRAKQPIKVGDLFWVHIRKE